MGPVVVTTLIHPFASRRCGTQLYLWFIMNTGYHESCCSNNPDPPIWFKKVWHSIVQRIWVGCLFVVATLVSREILLLQTCQSCFLNLHTAIRPLYNSALFSFLLHQSQIDSDLSSVYILLSLLWQSHFGLLAVQSSFLNQLFPNSTRVLECKLLPKMTCNIFNCGRTRCIILYYKLICVCVCVPTSL